MYMCQGHLAVAKVAQKQCDAKDRGLVTAAAQEINQYVDELRHCCGPPVARGLSGQAE